MAITDDFARLPLGAIKVERDARQRKVFQTEDLEKSIRRVGLIKPIIVARVPVTEPGREWDYCLVAGERRLEACRALGLPDIIVRFADELGPIELQIIELEENLKRQDLDWRDLVDAIARIHALYCELDPDWTMTETADAVSLTVGTVSMYLRINSERDDPRVVDAGTVREAYNVLARRDQRAAGNALEDLIAGPSAPAGPTTVPTVTNGTAVAGTAVSAINGKASPGTPPSLTLVPSSPAPESILAESFFDWAPAYTGRKFNLVHCDFPYGVELFSGPQGRGAEPSAPDTGKVGYEDSAELYWRLLEHFCTHLDKFMSVSGHLMFWSSADDEIVWRTREVFRRLAPSLSFYKFRLVWVKSDNAGIAGDATRSPRHVYETCLLASRSRRQIVRIMADSYSAPTDKSLHPSTKPEPMLRHFMTMLVDSGTELFDPTCGSGAALRAAESLGAKRVLGLELDPGSAAIARKALRNSRALRGASGGGR